MEVDRDSDEETTVVKQKIEERPKRTHKQRNEHKKLAADSVKQPKVEINNELPEHIKEKKSVIHRDYHVPKELGEGHTLDRRSGTGRVDRPRKQGGGRGNIGNLKDEQNQDKYIKQVDTAASATEEAKPQIPQAKTLEEYYREKGIQMNYELKQQKVLLKKEEINADWLKKEKLTVLQTKEDKKKAERLFLQTVKQKTQVMEQENNLALFGFGSQPKEERNANKHRNSPKLDFSEKDFPSL